MFSKLSATNDAFHRVNGLLAQIKPMNLISLITTFFKTPSLKTAMKTFMKMLELFDIYYSMHKNLFAFIKLVVQSLRNLPRYCKEIFDFVCKLVPGYKTRIEPEADDDTIVASTEEVLQKFDIDPKILPTGYMNTILPLLLGLIAIIGTSVGATTKTGSALLKAISLGSSATTNFFKVFGTTGDVFDSIRDFLHSAYGIGTASDKKIKMQQEKDYRAKQLADEKSQTDYLVRLNNKAAEMTALVEQLKFDPTAILGSPEGPAEIAAHLATCDALTREAATHRFTSSQGRLSIDQLRTAAKLLERQYHDSLASIKGKLEPTLIWLYGQSGIGKSYLVKTLINMLSRHEQRILTRYYRNPSQKHWDGYANQDVVVYDDFGQDNENTDHKELFQIFTEASFLLPMASVEQKGMRFTSPYVIICSNQLAITTSETTKDCTILNRRRDLLFAVRDAEYEQRYAEGTVTSEWRLQHVQPDFSHLRFVRMNPLPDKSGIQTEMDSCEYDLRAIAQEMKKIRDLKTKLFETTAAQALEDFRNGATPAFTEPVQRTGRNPQMAVQHPISVDAHINMLCDELTDLGFRTVDELSDDVLQEPRCNCGDNDICDLCAADKSCSCTDNEFCEVCLDVENQGFEHKKYIPYREKTYEEDQYTLGTVITTCSTCHNRFRGYYPCHFCAYFYSIFPKDGGYISQSYRCHHGIGAKVCMSVYCKLVTANMLNYNHFLKNTSVMADALRDHDFYRPRTIYRQPCVLQMRVGVLQELDNYLKDHESLNIRRESRRLAISLAGFHAVNNSACECVFHADLTRDICDICVAAKGIKFFPLCISCGVYCERLCPNCHLRSCGKCDTPVKCCELAVVIESQENTPGRVIEYHHPDGQVYNVRDKKAIAAYLQIIRQRLVEIPQAQNQGLEDVIQSIIWSPKKKVQVVNPIDDSLFETITHKRYPIIFLLGDAGTGKTVASKFKTTHSYKRFDDFPTQNFSEVADLVWKVYEGEFEDKPFGLILTANTEPFYKACADNGVDPTAFIRRTTLFKFSFKSGWFRKFSTPDLSTSRYSDVVHITMHDHGEQPMICELEDIHAQINAFSIRTEETRQALDLPYWYEAVNPVFTIHINKEFYSSMKEISFSDFHLTGNYTKHFKTFLQTFQRFKSRKFRTCDAALKSMMTEDFAFGEEGSILIQTIDVSIIVFIHKTGPMQLYRLAQHVAIEDIEQDNILAFFSEIQPVFDFLSNLVIYAGTIFSCVDDVIETVKHKPRASKKRIHDEAFYNSDDELSDYEYPEDSPYFVPHTGIQNGKHGQPKSAVAAPKKQKEYCPEHHTMDYCLWTEVESFFDDYEGQTRSKRFKTGVLPEMREEKEVTIKRSKEIIENLESAICKERRNLDIIKTPHQTGIKNEDWSFPDQRARRRPKIEIIPPEQKKVGPKNTVTITATNEALCDPAALDVSRLVAENTVYVIGQSGNMICRAIMVGRRLGVTVKHICETETIRVRTKEGTIYNATCYPSTTPRDISIFELEPRSREFKDIKNHFFSRKDTESLRNARAFMNVVSFRDDTMYVEQRSIILKENITYASDGVKRAGIQYVGHFDSFSMNASMSIAGDCGSGLVLIDPKKTRKIVGIHTAGSSQFSIAAIVFQEDFNLPIIKAQSSDEITILKCNGIEPAEGEFCGFPVFGRTVFQGKKITQFNPHATKLYTSPFRELYPDAFEPAILSNRDPRNPGHDFVHTGPQKWLHEQPEIDEEILNDCIEEWTEYLVGQFTTNHIDMKILTKTEAINGTSSEGSNPIYRLSSAGYPLRHLPGVQFKKNFFEQDPEKLIWTITKDKYGCFLNDAVDRIIDTCKTSRPACAFLCSLKDESRKRSKIYDTPATRTFAACALDYTIAQRMYFHTAAAGFTALHAILPPKIGIDTKSLEWNDLYHYMASNSDIGFDMDFKDWDATVPKRFMQALPVIYNRLYQALDPDWKPEHDVIRYNLHSVLHGPLLVIDDYVVKAPGGQVSGQPLTALDNCLVNMLYSLYIWKKLAPPAMKTFAQYKQNVQIAVYGDDNITTIKERVSHFFNFLTYAEECKKLNLIVTTAAKEGDIKPFMPLKDMEFLKMHFTKIGSYWIGKPCLASIQKMISFTKSSPNHVWAYEQDKMKYTISDIQETVADALMFAAPHPPEFFNELRDGLRRICADHCIPIEHWPTQKSLIFDHYFKLKHNT